MSNVATAESRMARFTNNIIILHVVLIQTGRRRAFNEAATLVDGADYLQTSSVVCESAECYEVVLITCRLRYAQAFRFISIDCRDMLGPHCGHVGARAFVNFLLAVVRFFHSQNKQISVHIYCMYLYITRGLNLGTRNTHYFTIHIRQMVNTSTNCAEYE